MLISKNYVYSSMIIENMSIFYSTFVAFFFPVVNQTSVHDIRSVSPDTQISKLFGMHTPSKSISLITNIAHKFAIYPTIVIFIH